MNKETNIQIRRQA